MVQNKLPLINSAHGSETRNIINELIELFNGMGHTYNESLQKAQDILDEAQQTNDMNESVQQQINTLIAESGTSDAEVLQARIDAEGNEYPVLKDRLDESDAQLAQIETDPTFKASTSTESASLGTELVDSSGWTVPNGWSGSFATGFKNTVGNTNTLTKTIGGTGTKLYQVSFRVESPTGAGVPNASTDFAVTLGNSEPFVTYNGGGTKDYAFGIQSVSDGDLTFIPGETFDGTIKNVSVKEVVGEVSPSLNIKDALDKQALEIRTTKSDLQNLYIGKDSGIKNTTGLGNVAIGDMTLVRNTTGYWNAALGKDALRDNTTGSRNVALGYQALEENISGDRNIGIGTYTLMRNTTGRQNIALGADALWVNTTGSRNIAMGMGTMGENVTGSENTAIGYAALEGNVSGSNNIAIGFNAMYDNKTSDNNIAIGRESLKRNIAGINIGIGFGALSWNTTGASNISMGHGSLSRSKLGSENVVFGHYAAASGAYGDGISQNTIIGAWAGNKLTTGGNNNTLIGYSAGRELTTGVNNIIIGRYVGDALTTESYVLNIGNLIYGDLRAGSDNQRVGIGIPNPAAKLHLQYQTANAGSAPIKLTANSTLMTTPEAGAIEFTGSKMYITTADGVRRELAFVS